MEYVEFLRARKAFAVYGIVLFCIVALIYASGSFALHAHDHSRIDFRLPLGFILGLMSFPAIVLATVLAASLNKENRHAGFAFTKPAPRARIALGYIAIDVATIVLGYLYGVALVLAAVALLGIGHRIVIGPGTAQVAFAGLGAAFMWYGLLQASTAGRVSNGSLIIGLSYPLFFLAAALYQIDAFGPIFHAVVAAVDVVNPFAYFSFQSHENAVTVTSLFGLSQAACIAVSWSMAAAGCAAAIVAWKRVQL